MASPKDVQLAERLDNIYPELMEKFVAIEQEDLVIADREFRALADCNLGPDYDNEKIERIANLQQKLQVMRIGLDKDLERKAIRPEVFLARFNTVIADIFSECERILGEKDFERLFGAPLNETKSLIDPGIFLQQLSK